jgi:hypothetical protein
MPELTRRRSPDRHQERWLIYYGDVHVGTIGERAGVPVDVDQWEWRCGFYPGLHRGEGASGTAATFEDARVDFEAAWAVYLPKQTEADFDAWCDQRDWTERKYAMWERGEKLPSQIPSSMMGCPCGERFDSHDPGGSYVHRQHIYAAQTARVR